MEAMELLIVGLLTVIIGLLIFMLIRRAQPPVVDTSKLEERLIRVESELDKIAPKIEGEFRENRKEITENLQGNRREISDNLQLIQKTVDTDRKSVV